MKRLNVLTFCLALYAAVMASQGVIAQGRQLLFPKGSERQPGLAVEGTRTGMFLTDDSNLAVTVNGRKTAEFTAPSTPGAGAGHIVLGNGTSLSDPTITNPEGNVGITILVGSIEFDNGSSVLMRSNSGGFHVPNGSVDDPSITSLFDSDTGLSFGDDILQLSAGGEDVGAWKVQRGTLTATQVRTLNASPVVVVPAVGVGKSITVGSMQVMLDWNATVYDSVGAGEDLFLYNTAAGETQRICDSVTCINAVAVADAFGESVAPSGTGGHNHIGNDSLTLQMASGEWATTDDDTDGDSPLHYLIRYRVVTLALDLP